MYRLDNRVVVVLNWQKKIDIQLHSHKYMYHLLEDYSNNEYPHFVNHIFVKFVQASVSHAHTQHRLYTIFMSFNYSITNLQLFCMGTFVRTFENS